MDAGIWNRPKKYKHQPGIPVEVILKWKKKKKPFTMKDFQNTDEECFEYGTVSEIYEFTE